MLQRAAGALTARQRLPCARTTARCVSGSCSRQTPASVSRHAARQTPAGAEWGGGAKHACSELRHVLTPLDACMQARLGIIGCRQAGRQAGRPARLVIIGWMHACMACIIGCMHAGTFWHHWMDGWMHAGTAWHQQKSRTLAKMPLQRMSPPAMPFNTSINRHQVGIDARVRHHH